MKKIITFSAALVLGICAFGATRNVRAAKATLDDGQVTAMKAMMGKYINSESKYTKKSRIFIKKDVSGYDVGIFHANHDALERTTYYAPGALLMGDLNGGFSTINSGYANSGENMVHFRSEDGVNGLTISGSRSIDYTVTGKTMADYFYDLNDLIDSIQAGDWAYDSVNTQYYHNISSLTVTDGEYNDQVLKKFQYFAAPMLLQSAAEHYLSPTSIVVKEEGGALNIRIYTSHSDSGKITREDDMLAESRVYSGLVQPGYYMVGNFNGDSSDWQIDSGRPLNKPAEGTDIGVLLNTNIENDDTKVQICQLKEDGETAWLHNVPLINSYAFAEMDGNDIKIKYDGNYNIFLNKDSEIYFERNNAKAITINVDVSSISGWSPTPTNFALHIWTTESGDIGSWGNDNQKMTLVSGTNYTYSFSYFGSVEGVIFYFKQDTTTKETQNLKGTNQFHNGDTLTITIGSMTWSGDTITGGVTLTTNS